MIFHPALPVPDATGIYTFSADLQTAHLDHQLDLGGRACDGDPTLMELTAPYSGERYLIETRQPSGRSLLVIEPHHDDFVLSASGTLLARPRPLTVVTVFTRSLSAHRSVTAEHPDEDAISRLRAAEAAESLRVFNAEHIQLDHRDARPPYTPYDKDQCEQITEQLDAIRARHPGADLLAPAAVTRHPDHLLVHEAARRLGCTLFWDDVAFWQTYGLAVCDRQLFIDRTADTLTDELSDITDALLDKLTLLYLHASQLQPLAAMYRPLRYAWTTAAPLRTAPHQAQYAERFYRLKDIP